MTQVNIEQDSYTGAGRALWALVLAAFVVYLVGNARTPLWDRDEPRFAQATREMMETGDYVVPHFAGEVRYDKPILGYYFFAAGMRAFGANEFGARFFSGVFGALSVALVYLVARRMTGSARVGLWSAAILATAPVMFAESKMCTVDAGLLFWILLAFAALWRIYEGPCTWRPKVLLWTALALGVLTKGPVAPAALFVPVGLMALVARDRSFLRRMGWLWGVPLLVTLCLPWAVAVQAQTGGDFLRVALGKHVVGRAGRAMEGHGGFPGFYVVTLFGTFFPWAFFAVGGALESLKGLRDNRREIFLLSWAVGLIAVLEIAHTKMVHYSLPVFPALSIIVALFFDRAARAGDRRLLPGAVAALVMAAALAIAPVVALYKAGMMAAVFPFAGAGVILVAGMARVVYLSKHGKGLKAAFATMLAWLFLVAAWGLPAAGSCGATKKVVALVEKIQERLKKRAPVISCGYEEPSLVFYLGGDVEFSKLPRSAGDLATPQAPLILITRRKAEPILRLAGLLGEPGHTGAETTGVLVEAGSTRGFNFAKGRYEELVVWVSTLRTAAEGGEGVGQAPRF